MTRTTFCDTYNTAVYSRTSYRQQCNNMYTNPSVKMINGNSFRNGKERKNRYASRHNASQLYYN